MPLSNSTFALPPSARPTLVTFFVREARFLPASRPRNRRRVCGTVLLRDKNQRTMVVGLGDKDKIEATIRCARRRHGCQGVAQARRHGIALDLPAFADHVGPAVEGAILASYKFEGSARIPANYRGVLSRLQVIVKENELIRARAQAREAEIVATDRQHDSRHRQSFPVNMLTPEILAEKAR